MSELLSATHLSLPKLLLLLLRAVLLSGGLGRRRDDLYGFHGMGGGLRRSLNEQSSNQHSLLLTSQCLIHG